MREIAERYEELETKVQPIPYIVYESEMARTERREKRNHLTIIILILLLVFTNLAWLQYEMSFEDVVVTEIITQDNEDGINNYIGNDGEIINGKTDDN